MITKKHYFIWCLSIIVFIGQNNLLVQAQPIERAELDLPETIIEESPVLQRWLQETPDVLDEIRHDPSFQTRFKVGFSWFPSNDDAVGINLAVEDIFLADTGFTLSTDYYTTFNSDRVATGANLHYFLFPLGSYVNLAPLVGYRYIQSNDYSHDGVNLGIRLMLALSRTGAADLALSQSFISLGSQDEIGLTTFSVGYAFSPILRAATEVELQNSRIDQDKRFSFNLEFLW